MRTTVSHTLPTPAHQKQARHQSIVKAVTGFDELQDNEGSLAEPILREAGRDVSHWCAQLSSHLLRKHFARAVQPRVHTACILQACSHTKAAATST